MIKKEFTNRLLDILVEKGHDPAQFEMICAADRTRIDINYPKTGHLFTLRSGDTFHTFNFSVNSYAPQLKLVLSVQDGKFSTEVVPAFQNWLSNIREIVDEEQIPDHWEYMKNNPLSIASINFSDSAAFKLEEREQLKLGLEEMKLLIKQRFDVTEDQVKLTNQKLDYLIAATSRLNKTDWKGIAISTIISISYDLSLSSEKQAVLMGLFSKIWAIVRALPPHLG